jgi:hypothetical protein
MEKYWLRQITLDVKLSSNISNHTEALSSFDYDDSTGLLEIHHLSIYGYTLCIPVGYILITENTF